MNKQNEKAQELVYGVHPILELLKAKRRKIYTLYTTKPLPKSAQEIFNILPKEVQIQYVARDILTRIAGTTDHQSLVAWASPLVIRKKFFEAKTSPFLIMLDGIQDPRNLGAIIRSSYCTGVDGIIITTKSSSPINSTVLKSAAGLAEHVDILQVPSIAFAIDELKKAGYQLYFATLEGKEATSVSYNQPLCLVIGNEAVGITKNVLTQGSQISLPQRNSDISYNASVAAGILLFLISTQIKKI